VRRPSQHTAGQLTLRVRRGPGSSASVPCSGPQEAAPSAEELNDRGGASPSSAAKMIWRCRSLLQAGDDYPILEVGMIAFLLAHGVAVGRHPPIQQLLIPQVLLDELLLQPGGQACKRQWACHILKPETVPTINTPSSRISSPHPAQARHPRGWLVEGTPQTTAVLWHARAARVPGWSVAACVGRQGTMRSAPQDLGRSVSQQPSTPRGQRPGKE
jgi:hypothetical protein